MNVLGEIGSPCLVPIVVKNHSPISLPPLTVDFDLFPMFRKIPTSLFPTPHDFNVAQVTSCLMESNAFWKSTKQLYTRLFFVWLFQQSVLASGFVKLYFCLF